MREVILHAELLITFTVFYGDNLFMHCHLSPLPRGFRPLRGGEQ